MGICASVCSWACLCVRAQREWKWEGDTSMNHLCSSSSAGNVSLMLKKTDPAECETQAAAPTLALSITFENSPIQTTQCSGVTNRKQSPLFSEDALGSTSLVWTWRRPADKEVKKIVILKIKLTRWMRVSRRSTKWSIFTEKRQKRY